MTDQNVSKILKQFNEESIFVPPDKKTKYYCHDLNKDMGFMLTHKWVFQFHRRTDIKALFAVNKTFINETTEQGWTPLMIAVANSRILDCEDLVDHLIELGADINARANEGWTPLMMAARNANNTSTLRVLKKLIDSGAFLNAKDREFKTALHWAVGDLDNDSCFEAVEMLVLAGANVNQTSPLISNLIEFCLKYSDNDVKKTVNLLIEHGASMPLLSDEYKEKLYGYNLKIITNFESVEGGLNGYICPLYIV